MSEQAIIYLESVGLLGQYFPSSRKKHRPFPRKISCMHLEPYQGSPEFCGCFVWQPPIVEGGSSLQVLTALKANIATACTSNSKLCCL
ncbi:hypothetical protein K1719_032418 [Acacia pycnantha]|nr:hypothetical protein K1719_032418 [Acacia pycnantha]